MVEQTYKSYQHFIERMKKAGVKDQLTHEFLSKGLRRAAIDSISSQLNDLETQSTILRNIARELIIEDDSENVSGTREE